jgi:myo-inositol catabolism protein IolC
MTDSGAERLYMLSFDHRASFEKELMGITGTPTAEEHQRISALKTVIYAGFADAITKGVPPEACAVLVDEDFGADVARTARAAGRLLAMPVERSGQDEFDFEFGTDFAEHVQRFDPDFVKVLVRYNPDGDAELNRRQAIRLARLSEWLHAEERRFLFELLIPATPEQQADAGFSQDSYDALVRPGLVVRTISELQHAGVEPNIWKIEGLDDRADCERAVAQARAGGRGDVTCVVLGRGADLGRVARWLTTAAPVAGYIGFAVGRTIWLDPLREHVAGRLDRTATVESIAANYRQMVDVYAAAAESPSVHPAPAG